jgi:hypothetical protein
MIHAFVMPHVMMMPAAMAAKNKPGRLDTQKPGIGGSAAPQAIPSTGTVATAEEPSATTPIADQVAMMPTPSAAMGESRMQGTPEPAVKRRSRALSGLSDAKTRLIKKFSSAVAGEAGSQPMQIKLSALKTQLLNFAHCCYRESAGSHDWLEAVAQPALSEVLADGRDAAIAGPTTDKAGLLLGEVQKLLKESLHLYEDLQADLQQQITAWAGLNRLPGE